MYSVAAIDFHFSIIFDRKLDPFRVRSSYPSAYIFIDVFFLFRKRGRSNYPFRLPGLLHRCLCVLNLFVLFFVFLPRIIFEMLHYFKCFTA
jgi:hypothetical protein